MQPIVLSNLQVWTRELDIRSSVKRLFQFVIVDTFLETNGRLQFTSQNSVLRLMWRGRRTLQKKQLQIRGPWTILNHVRYVSLRSAEVIEILNVALIPAPVPLCSGSESYTPSSAGIAASLTKFVGFVACIALRKRCTGQVLYPRNGFQLQSKSNKHHILFLNYSHFVPGVGRTTCICQKVIELTRHVESCTKPKQIDLREDPERSRKDQKIVDGQLRSLDSPIGAQASYPGGRITPSYPIVWVSSLYNKIYKKVKQWR